MSRKPRVWYPGATYHITARGNRKAAIFQETDDYLKYLEILKNVQTAYPFILHSYCLMTNHIHLQIETIDDHIKYIMKDLHFRYATYFNKKYDFVGHVFQGRYGASIIENISYFLETSRYIHRNPLEANIVKDLADYRWSSYLSFISNVKNPHVNPEKTLNYFAAPPQKNYQIFVETDINLKSNETWQHLLNVTSATINE
ncbi:transposase [Bacillus kwashiorkori]|uniref:transposase n=1 Tax=Bacillus kwashiorkori TaxID=1522318 RepID=UPI000782C0F1|nr:transposase [Bacillus kwashiorkori]